MRSSALIASTCSGSMNNFSNMRAPLTSCYRPRKALVSTSNQWRRLNCWTIIAVRARQRRKALPRSVATKLGAYSRAMAAANGARRPDSSGPQRMVLQFGDLQRRGVRRRSYRSAITTRRRTGRAARTTGGWRRARLPAMRSCPCRYRASHLHIRRRSPVRSSCRYPCGISAGRA